MWEFLDSVKKKREREVLRHPSAGCADQQQAIFILWLQTLSASLQSHFEFDFLEKKRTAKTKLTMILTDCIMYFFRISIDLVIYLTN